MEKLVTKRLVQQLTIFTVDNKDTPVLHMSCLLMGIAEGLTLSKTSTTDILKWEWVV